MLSMMIVGPRQPGNDIDVYLTPLIEDLKKLWVAGVDVYDEIVQQTFRLCAMIFCIGLWEFERIYCEKTPHMSYL